jgi:hypothetical protein
MNFFYVPFLSPAFYGIFPCMDSWHSSYHHEIEQAKLTRLAGNEGRARVCARRAASILIAEYLTRQGMQAPSSSAQVRLLYLSALPGLSPAAYEITSHLLMRVDESFSLPDHIDLIADVQRLAEELSIQ